MKEDNYYNKIIGIKDDEIYVVDYTFGEEGEPKGFHGATGYSMRPLKQYEIDDGNDPYNNEDLWMEAVRNGDTYLGLEDWVEQVLVENMSPDQLFPYDDTSYREEFNDLLDELPEEQKKIVEDVFGKKGVNFVEWTSSRGGRCFSKDDEWDYVFNQELLDEIMRFEED